MVPSTWTSGSQNRMFYRLVVKPVEYGPGPEAILEAGYSLLQPQYANERFLWQKIIQSTQVMGDQAENVSVNWSGRAHIKEDEALFLIIENQSGGIQTVNIITFLRTLMRADG